MKSETERAVARAERLAAELSERAGSISGEQWRHGIAVDSPGGLDLAVPFRARAALDSEALRHLIAEARWCERVREWTKEGYKFFPEMIDGFEWAQCEVRDILSAPDAETKEESR